MPKGPLGFPRLTTIGPFVKPTTVQPHEDIPENVYDLDFISSVQGQTAHDTERALVDIIEYDLDLGREFLPRDVTFRYRKEQIGELLEINSFSSTLLEAMSKAEEKGIPLEGEEKDYIVRNERLESEVRSHMDGGSSIFTDDLLAGIDAQWEQIANGLPEWMSESEARDEIVKKVVADFDRVMDINNSIRESHEYFPPTTENVKLGGVVGWGTIDGAHRIVALSQILGTDEEIYIWEWDNQKMFIEESPVV